MKSLAIALAVAVSCGSFMYRVQAQAPAPEQLINLQAFEDLLQAPSRGLTSGLVLTLGDAERIALEQNPQIAIATRRVAVAEAHLPIAGTLDDPSAMYRGWGVPLRQPWDFNQAQNMFSLSQTFPGKGKRALRTSVAQSDVDVAKAELAETRLEVQVRVRKAFNDLLLADEETKIHEGHVGIARQAIEAARIKYAVGKVSQQDVLKAQLAMTALAEHMIRFDRDAGVARARLNTLLGRDPACSLQVKGQFSATFPLPALETLEEVAVQSRPDLEVARDAADRSHKQEALANKAYLPDFTVSGGYSLMPPNVSMRNSYMIEGSMNLPWLNRRKHNAEVAAASAAAVEQETESDALRTAAFGQIGEALAQAKAAQRFARLYQDQLRPQAEATLQSSVVAYENDRTDFLNLLNSQMEVIDVELEWAQAMADFDSRLADLELAVGAEISQLQQTATEVKP